MLMCAGCISVTASASSIRSQRSVSREARTLRRVNRILVPAGREFDSWVYDRPAGILLISRAAAPPTPRAYQSAIRPPGITPAGREFDSWVYDRPAGILLISRAAAPPTPRAYQSAIRPPGIRQSVPNRKFAIVGWRPIRDTRFVFSVACLSPSSAAECGELRGQDTKQTFVACATQVCLEVVEDASSYRRSAETLRRMMFSPSASSR